MIDIFVDKMRELAKKRKEKETDFEEKRMNLSLEVSEEKAEPVVPRGQERAPVREVRVCYFAQFCKV